MKLPNKNIIYLIAGAIVILVLVAVILSRSEGGSDIVTTPTPLASDLLTPSPTPTVILNSQTAKPSPGIISEEVPSFEALAKEYDKESRYLLLNQDCTSITPSNIDYPNNTKVIIDNYYSKEAVVLKIGETEYSLEAGQWIFATFSTNQIPTSMKIVCKGLELGQIDLVR